MSSTQHLTLRYAAILLGLASGTLVDGRSLRGAEREPVVMICTAGINRIIEDIEYVGRLSKRPRLPAAAHDLLIQVGGLEGIDRTRPVGVLLYIAEPLRKDPDVLLAIPVSSREGFLRLLQKIPGISIAGSPSEAVVQIQAGDKRPRLRWLEGYALISESSRILDSDLSDVAARLTGQAMYYDWSISLHRSGVPQELIDTALENLPERIRRDSHEPEGESPEDRTLRLRIQGLAIRIGQILLSGFQEFMVGVEVSPEAEGARLHAQFAAASGSDLAKHLAALPGEGQAFGQLTRHCAFQFQWNAELPSALRTLLLDVISSRSEAWRIKVKEHLPQKDWEPLSKALTSIAATLRAGHFRGMFGFADAGQSHMVLLISQELSDPGAIEEAVKVLIPYAQQSGDVREIHFNLRTIAGAPVHRLQGKPAREQDRKIYGGEPSVFLAFGSPCTWLAVGTDLSLEVLEKAIPILGINPQDRSILRGTLRVHPWIPLIAADNKDEKLLDALQEAFPEPVPDRLQFTLQSTTSGLEIQVTADEAYLHFLGIALDHGLTQ